MGQDASNRDDDVTTPKPPTGEHLVCGEFQSDKYPSCPVGKVPLSTKDKTAQDLLWIYAQRRRVVDPEFATDLEAALKWKGFVVPSLDAETRINAARRFIDQALQFVASKMNGIPEGSKAFQPVTREAFEEIAAPLRMALARLATFEQMIAKAEMIDWLATNEASVHFKNPTGFVWNVVTHNGEIDEGGETLVEAIANAMKSALRLRKDRLLEQREWWKANTPPEDEHAKGVIRQMNLMIGDVAELIRKVEHNLILPPMSYAIRTPSSTPEIETKPKPEVRPAVVGKDGGCNNCLSRETAAVVFTIPPWKLNLCAECASALGRGLLGTINVVEPIEPDGKKILIAVLGAIERLTYEKDGQRVWGMVGGTALISQVELSSARAFAEALATVDIGQGGIRALEYGLCEDRERNASLRCGNDIIVARLPIGEALTAARKINAMIATGRVRERKIVAAAEQMDWQQVVLNGGPPCFHIDGDDGHFCGRAERWDGHRQDIPTPGVDHPFVSLAQLLSQT